ncbi:c-type cytochrome [Vibrio zhugei]|uniref:C-type cytochrome n=1 Tax=Vibrio zhugei TaxID=2479546 RepID=A0ABV7CCG2_9VIBR|nr:cytochrome c [Vibrio zhugei]
MRYRSYFIAIILVIFVFVGAIVSGVWQPTTHSPANIQQVKTTDFPDDMSRGEYVAKMSDCTACHTTDASKPFAGGLAMPLPIGTIYSTNITPDKEDGIGDYSLADFKRVLREGIRKDGGHLYPAMPYTEYSKLSDEDIAALYQYFMKSVKPIHEPNRANDIPAVLSMRWPLSLWNWMFHTQGAYQRQPDKSDAWNRGAYLVQGAAHCGTCHTPRGIAMQTVANDEKTKGFLSGEDLGGWHAFNITNDKQHGLGNWTQAEIVQYLKTGSVAGKAQAAGTMGEAVEHSFQYLTDDDLNAIATYLRSVPAVSEDGPSRFTQGKPESQDLDLRGIPLEDVPATQHAQSLYMGNCAACHGADGGGSPDGYYPSLYHNSVVGSNKPNNLIQVILNGVHRKTQSADVMMPAFGRQLSDQDVADIVNFVTKTYGQKEAKVTADNVKMLRSQTEATP